MGSASIMCSCCLKPPCSRRPASTATHLQVGGPLLLALPLLPLPHLAGAAAFPHLHRVTGIRAEKGRWIAQRRVRPPCQLEQWQLGGPEDQEAQLPCHAAACTRPRCLLFFHPCMHGLAMPHLMRAVAAAGTGRQQVGGRVAVQRGRSAAAGRLRRRGLKSHAYRQTYRKEDQWQPAP